MDSSVEDMTTYVLIPGFWLGGWAWRPVTDALRAHGHDVHPLDLTGMGDRAHLAGPDTDLETHIGDVLDLLTERDLHDVVLVGHSYAGAMVTPAVADRVPDRIATLAFVDTGPLPDGMSQSQFGPPEEQARNADLVQRYGDGWQLPPPPWPQLAAGTPAVGPDTLAELAARAVPQPWRTATTPARLTGAWEKLPRLGILCGFTAAQARGMAAAAPAFAHMDGEQWRYAELPTWHWPMFSRPAELADILHRAG
jgi:pimeloyl-ACP methyl ester carboxylesterase